MLIRKAIIFQQFDIYIIKSPITNSIIHSCLNAFYLPYRLHDKYKIVEEFINENNDIIANIESLSLILNRTIYIIKENTKNINAYNKVDGIGCICLLKNNNKYDLIALLDKNNAYITNFTKSNEFIDYLNVASSYKNTL